MNLDQLLLGLAEELELPELQLNPNGVCQLLVDDDLAVTIENAPLENAVHLYVLLGKMPEKGRESLMTTLLEAQLFQRETGEGSAFGYDSQTDEIFLCRRLSLGGLGQEEFRTALTEITNWGGHWMAKIASANDRVSDSIESALDHFIRA